MVIALLTYPDDVSFSCHVQRTIIYLHNSNNLYFILGSGHSSTGSSISRLTTKPQMLSELRLQRFGQPGPTQLNLLAHHSTGLPSKLTDGLHPIQSSQVCHYGKIKHSPMGDTSDTIKPLPGTRFHLDFGFIRSSSLDFGVMTGHHMFTSYYGNTTFLRIVCAKACHAWVFCQPSKAPPIHILERFLEVNGLKEGPRFFCINPGGELW
jgi:hypothetical protein